METYICMFIAWPKLYYYNDLFLSIVNIQAYLSKVEYHQKVFPEEKKKINEMDEFNRKYKHNVIVAWICSMALFKK